MTKDERSWFVAALVALTCVFLILAVVGGRTIHHEWGLQHLEDRLDNLARQGNINSENIAALAGVVEILNVTPTPWSHEIEIQSEPPVTVLVPFPLMDGVSEQELRWCFRWVSYDQVGNCLFQMAENGEP